MIEIVNCPMGYKWYQWMDYMWYQWYRIRLQWLRQNQKRCTSYIPVVQDTGYAASIAYVTLRRPPLSCETAVTYRLEASQLTPLYGFDWRTERR